MHLSNAIESAMNPKLIQVREQWRLISMGYHRWFGTNLWLQKIIIIIGILGKYS